MFMLGVIQTETERRWLERLFPLFPGLCRMAQRYFPRDDTENQDAVQDVFTKLADRPAFYRGKILKDHPLRFRGYLVVMTRTASYDLLRRRATQLRRALPLDLHQGEAASYLGPPGGDPYHRLSDSAWLEWALDRLSAQQAEAVILHLVYQLSCREVAKVMPLGIEGTRSCIKPVFEDPAGPCGKGGEGMKGYYDYHAGSDPTPDEIMFDNLLAKALGSYLERQGRQLDVLCQEEGAPMPLEFQRKTTRRCQRRKAARRAASLFLAAAVGFFLMMGTVEAFRVNVINTYINMLDDISELIFQGQNGVPPAEGIIFPGYIPEGFKLVDSDNIGGIFSIKYTNGSKFILFKQQKLSNTNYHDAGLDAEDFNITIGEYYGNITTKEDEVLLLWYTDNILYQINSNLDPLQTIKIAESLKAN